MEIPQLKSLYDNKSIVYELQLILSQEVKKSFNLNIDVFTIEVGKTSDSKFGDFTSNIALKISKQVGKNPREIADQLRLHITDSELQDRHQFIEKVDVAGPGFLNFYLKEDYFLENLNTILEQKNDYGKWNIAEGRVMVEFGQPNTHKAFHVGHLKSAITGLGVVRLFENLGFNVVKANFYGDVGMHVAKCVWGFIQKSKDISFKSKIENENDPHLRMKLLDSCYVYASKEFRENPDSEKEIREINKKIYARNDTAILENYLLTLEWSLDHLNSIFAELGVVYDRQYPESEVYPIGIEKVNENLDKIFIRDKGALILPGEKYGVDRWVFVTHEGNPTYSAKDYGLAIKKFEEYPDLSISAYTTSVEQIAYFKGVFKAIELSDTRFIGKLLHIPFGWMLREDKKKFSSRLGQTIKGIDVLNESKDYSLKKISKNKSYKKEEAEDIARKISIAGLKFLILSHELHRDLTYNPEDFLNPEGFSGPYVLYAYVRARSILREASYSSKTPFSNLNTQLNDDELTLLKLISQFPLTTLNAGKTLSPHLIANYIFELAQEFNKFYKNNKVIVEDENVKNFRLALTEAVSIVLANGLYLLGIETIEKM